MITIEQVAMRTDNIEEQIKHLALMGHQPEAWIRDTVEALHIFKSADLDAQLGDSFKVHLAFNYEFITGTSATPDEHRGVEFELIQLVAGRTAQLLENISPCSRMSHFGYHVANQNESNKDALLEELLMLQQMGTRVIQVSQTITHANTNRRYRYAFVNGNLTGGVPVKVIQRLLPHAKKTTTHDSIEQGRKLFECLQ